ncbi:hypothetical protein WR25_13542 [Diploscapter pachys]|uniref:Nematode cuticle collagen N-terminal domain-containing protein n=1 Tax=Diploscapter pachys TaxID=2018661 RepID=A0A2A2JD41_9BILA|nr:hypothetical protein WR25_13542 [Diploscapter pachys]
MTSFAGVASGLCGVAILASIIACGYIYNDINSFVDDAERDLGEFKLYANDAWNTMIASMAPQNVRDVRAIFKRHRKRHDSCNCGPAPTGCPPGWTARYGILRLFLRLDFFHFYANFTPFKVTMESQEAPEAQESLASRERELDLMTRSSHASLAHKDQAPMARLEDLIYRDNPDKEAAREHQEDQETMLRTLEAPQTQAKTDNPAAPAPMETPVVQETTGGPGQPGSDSAYCPCPSRSGSAPVVSHPATQPGDYSQGPSAPAAPSAGGYSRRRVAVKRRRLASRRKIRA